MKNLWMRFVNWWKKVKLLPRRKVEGLLPETISISVICRDLEKFIRSRRLQERCQFSLSMAKAVGRHDYVGRSIKNDDRPLINVSTFLLILNEGDYIPQELNVYRLGDGSNWCETRSDDMKSVWSYVEKHDSVLYVPHLTNWIIAYLCYPLIKKRNNLCSPKKKMMQQYTTILSRLNAVRELKQYWVEHPELEDQIERLEVIEEELSLIIALECSTRAAIIRMYDIYTSCMAYIRTFAPRIEEIITREREAYELARMRQRVDELQGKREELEHAVVAEFVTQYEETRKYMFDVESAITAHSMLNLGLPQDSFLTHQPQINAYIEENLRLEETLGSFVDKAHFRDDVAAVEKSPA